MPKFGIWEVIEELWENLWEIKESEIDDSPQCSKLLLKI